MNLDIIHKHCTEWSKETWQAAYSQYCKYNQFGRMSKKEYYDFVRNNHKRIKERDTPLSAELASKWSTGRRNARLWAEKVGYCATPEPEPMSVAELAKQVRELEWRVVNK